MRHLAVGLDVGNARVRTHRTEPCVRDRGGIAVERVRVDERDRCGVRPRVLRRDGARVGSVLQDDDVAVGAGVGPGRCRCGEC